MAANVKTFRNGPLRQRMIIIRDNLMLQARGAEESSMGDISLWKDVTVDRHYQR